MKGEILHVELKGVLWGFFWLRYKACGMLVPQPGVEPAPPAVEAQSLNHWTTREVPPQGVFVDKLLLPHKLSAMPNTDGIGVPSASR